MQNVFLLTDLSLPAGPRARARAAYAILFARQYGPVAIPDWICCMSWLVGITVAALMLTSCSVQLEPSYDARIVREIETLTLETQTFFASYPDGIPVTGHTER